MGIVHTHSFNGVLYHLDFPTTIEGVTDTPEAPKKLYMEILAGNDFKAFHSAFHESLEGSGFCDKCLHKKDGTPNTIDAARLLWRLGYRKSQGE